MKKFEDFTKEELWALRKEITLNSLYFADYRNSFGIDCHSVYEFFEGYCSDLEDRMREDGKEDVGNNFFKYLNEYDNPDNLESWFYCYEDFSWVRYEEE